MKVTFFPQHKFVEVEQGKSILQIAQEVGIAITATCGGNQNCGKCKVIVTIGNTREFTTEEKKYLTDQEKEQGVRLACCFIPVMDTVVMIPRTEFVKKERTFQKNLSVQNDVPLGLALDIGTTTLEYQVFDLEKKTFLIGDRCSNPQRIYGADVIARLTFMMKEPSHVSLLRQMLFEAINESLIKTLSKIGAKSSQVKKIVCVGNTTMSHILVNASIRTLAMAPCKMQYYGGEVHPAREFGFHMDKQGEVIVLPNIEGHVGSDLLACIIETGIDKQIGKQLLIDIGTNGEMVFVNNSVERQEMVCCSTAAGPAFEGGNLSCGMTASIGAITKVVLQENTLKYHVIGNVVPVGISGSGIIDLISCLRKMNRIDETGYLVQEEEKEFVINKENHLVVTQEDIRQIQLAKAAIYTGAKMILEECHVKVEECDHVYLAGAFGSNLDCMSAMHIGLIPAVRAEKVGAIGNAALRGAKKVLLGEVTLADCRELAKGIKHVELANRNMFQREFIEQLNFR